MSGYFSRLIQQTGIALETDKVSSSNSIYNQDFSAVESDKFLTTNLSIENVIPGNDGVKIATVEDGENYKQETMNRDSNSSSVPRLFSPNLVDPAAIPPNNNLLYPLENDVSQLSPSMDKEKLDFVEHNRERLSEIPQELNDDTLESKSARVTRNLEIEENPQKSRNLVKRIGRSQTIPAGELPEFRSQDEQVQFPEPDLFSTHQVNLQAVREWVAETGEENSKWATPRYAKRIQNSKENSSFLDNSEQQFQEYYDFTVGTLEDNQKNKFPIYHPPSPNSNYQESQNFTLSIGTISLTVEAPQSESQKPLLPPVKSKPDIKPARQTSRLNRHYIR
ncbi:MAG TPA: hypothetical protein DCY91_09480 [Cyanobacteria bacterium UBA11370]|nr:hypothetical protein [Cyanobacteria bacterium UBA11370]